MEKHSDMIIHRPEHMEKEGDMINPRSEHMEEKQGELINPRPEPVSGPSFTTVSGAGDTPSHGIQDQERSVIKVFKEGLKLLINYCSQIPRKVDQVLREIRENEFSSKLDEN